MLGQVAQKKRVPTVRYISCIYRNESGNKRAVLIGKYGEKILLLGPEIETFTHEKTKHC